MILANDIKKNDFLKINNKFYKVISIDHVKPGKGGAYINANMFDIHTLKNNPKRFNSDEKVEKVFVDQKKVYYSYEEGNDIYFNDEEGEEYIVNKNSDQDQLFFPHLEYVILFFYDNNILFYECPAHCVIQVKETSSPGNISSNSGRHNKPAILENNINIHVPNYITSGQKIKIDIRTLEYLEKVN